MKFMLFFCLLILLSAESIAQRDPEKLRYALKVEKFRKMKSIGSTLTVTGAILVVVGVSMIFKAASNSSQQSSTAANNTALNNGALVYLLGVGSLGAGIPLWIVGGHQQRKYEKKFENLSIGFNLAPQNTGLALRYRF